MKRQDAKETMDRKRVDFITRLPSELAAYIFDYLAAITKKEKASRKIDCTLVRCTTVSHRWRAILLEQDYIAKKLWRSASFFEHRGLTMNPTAKLLSTVGKNVEKIDFIYVREYILEKVKELAYAGRLPPLKELIFCKSIFKN